MNLTDLKKLRNDMQAINQIFVENIDTAIYTSKDIEVWNKAEHWFNYTSKKIESVRKQSQLNNLKRKK